MRIEVDPISGDAPLHSLMSTAIPLQGDPDSRWQDGVTWNEQMCAGVLTFRQMCDQTTVLTGTAEPAGVGTNDPNTFYMPYDCAVDAKHQEQVRQMVEVRLALGASKALEEVFWTDLAALNLNVDGTDEDATSGILNPTFASPTAVSPEVALMTMSQALANCSVGARGMIHAVPYLVEAWSQQQMLCQDEKGRLVTRSRGDFVVCGSGYTGVGPVGNAEATPTAGEVWTYATPMVGVRWSEISHQSRDLSVIVDRTTNTVRWMAEQTIGYQVDTDCCVFALLVDLP